MPADNLLLFKTKKNAATAKAICIWLIGGRMDDLPPGVDDHTFLLEQKRQINDGRMNATLLKRYLEYAWGRPMEIAKSDDRVNPINELNKEQLRTEIESSLEAMSGRERPKRSRKDS